ncbi:MAG: ribonuclease H-like domain-containing protein [Alicyclobacillus sp.]|nr:ribonuclease H-like domain-containing protein [Alicyclobacillus sp.]
MARRTLQERLAALEASVRSQHPAAADSEGRTAGNSNGGAAGDGDDATGRRTPVGGPVSGTESVSLDQTDPFAALGFTPDPASGILRRELRLDLLMRHGRARFADLLELDLAGLCRLAKVPPCRPSSLRFYDTETTGLGTGAGTVPFLHAVGWMEEDEFVVTQYFLRDYGEESRLLETLLANHLTGPDGIAVVSFNGKSFDWPLLKSRLAMHRLPVPDVPQVDLVHPSRRFWKQMLPRVSLGNVEASVLGLVRTDDLPGSEAPSRYFEFVADGDPARLGPVFDHNAADVCSLVALTVHLAGVVNGSIPLEHASEWAALGRVFDEWDETAWASRCFESATACPDVSWREVWLHSLHCKRLRAWATAEALWLNLTQRHEWTVRPCVELAKLYEHQRRDFAAALHWAETARRRAAAFPGGVRHSSAGLAATVARTAQSDVLRALDKRIERILRKMRG